MYESSFEEWIRIYGFYTLPELSTYGKWATLHRLVWNAQWIHKLVSNIWYEKFDIIEEKSSIGSIQNAKHASAPHKTLRFQSPESSAP